MPPEGRWLLFIPQVPPKPSYLRVKVWRRLRGVGAVPIKNSVYVLPSNDQTREDFQWLMREVVGRGGEASVCEARFVDGLSDEEVEDLFRAARRTDYARLAQRAGRLRTLLRSAREPVGDRVAKAEGELHRMRRRLAEVAAIDFVGTPDREKVETLLTDLKRRFKELRTGPPGKPVPGPLPVADRPTGRTWVTRRGIYIDRIASAWLIRRFIDPKARFKYVTTKGYRPLEGELRFDMFEGEFTHEGDRCTFEILVARFGLRDAALRAIAEIVHDIDLKESRFRRPEFTGLERLILGFAMLHKDDETRLERGTTAFDAMYEYFRRKRA